MLLQRKVGLIDDVEDFYRLINDKLEEGTKAYDMAIAKIHESVATDIENCSTDMDALYELKETYANNFNEFKPVYEKIFTLCKTQDDFEKLDNEINDNTCYLSYQISKKLESFYSDAPVVVEKKVVPVMEAKDPIEEEGQREETEFSRRCEEAEMEYISARSHEAARKAYNLSPAGSDVQKKAFAKLEKYIKESLAKSSLTQKQVLSIYKSAIPMTESWRLAIQKLAEFYKKPWWYI